MTSYKKLQDEYNKRNISLVCARNKQKYYLSIQNVPYTVLGLKEGVCQLTGYLTIYSRDRLEDIEEMVQTVYGEYKRIYATNPIMLSYI